MNLRRSLLVSAALGVVSIGSASADTFDLWQGGTNGTFLNTGTTYTSTFDANVLFDPGVDLIPFATLTLNFRGLESSFLAGTSYNVTAVGVLRNAGDTTNHYTDALDSANILIGKKNGQSALGSDLANAYSSTVLSSSESVYLNTEPGVCPVGQKCGPPGGGGKVPGGENQDPNTGYNRTYTETTGYKGPFSVVVNLDNNSLALFSSTGLLRYGFTVASGGVALDSATLQFHSAVPITPVIPEPETYALLLAGLGLLGFVTRRRANG
jgi:hypothetical protein